MTRRNTFEYRATVLLYILALLFWIALWRYPVLLPDDYYFMSRSGMPSGGTSISALYEHLQFDVTTRNGRIADLFVQVILSWRMPLTRIAMALLTWFFSVTIFALINFAIPLHERLPFSRIVVTLFSLSLPFYLMWVTRRLSGGLFYFTSATVGYVGGLVLLGVVIGLMYCSYRHPSAAYVFVGAGVLVATVAAWFHESIALALVGLACAMFVGALRGGDGVSRGAHAGGAVALVAVSIWRLQAPGLWARAEILGQQEKDFATRLVLAARAMAEFADAHFLAILACGGFVAALGALIVRTPNGAQKPYPARWLATVAGVMSIVWVASALLLQRLNFAPEGRAAFLNTPSARLAITLGTIVVVSGLIFFIALLGFLGGLGTGPKRKAEPLMFWVAFAAAGGLGTAAIAGTGTDRPAFFGIVLFYVTVAIIALKVSSIASRLSGDFPMILGKVCIGLALGLVVVAVPVAKDQIIGLRANSGVWTSATHTLTDGSAKPGDEILLPRRLPREDLTEWRPGHPAVPSGLRQYYSIPDSVTIEWAK